jgi:hypothetical protein
VVAWLDEEWVTASGEALAAPGAGAAGATGTVAVETTGGEGGTYWRTWADGVPVAGGSGKPPGPPDLSLTLPDADARAFWQGEWSASVAFMRGRLKVSGRMELLLPLLAASERWGDEGPRCVVAALMG